MATNPNWWGKLEGNLTEIVYTPIKSEATRVARCSPARSTWCSIRPRRTCRGCAAAAI